MSHSCAHRAICKTSHSVLLTPKRGNRKCKCRYIRRRRQRHNHETSRRHFERPFVSCTYVAYTCMHVSHVCIVSINNAHVHTYVGTHVCIYVCMCVHLGKSVHMYVCIYTTQTLARSEPAATVACWCAHPACPRRLSLRSFMHRFRVRGRSQAISCDQNVSKGCSAGFQFVRVSSS